MTDGSATAVRATEPGVAAPGRSVPPAARRKAALRRGWFAVLEREFLVATSRGPFIAIRTTVVALVAVIANFIIAVTAASEGAVDGLVLFNATAVAPLATLILLAPALSASSIASERSMDTLPLALAAPVTPAGFVLAKFVARLGVVLIPILGTIPITAVGFAYGGPSGSLLIAYIAFLFLFAVFGVAIGVCASAYSETVARATLWAYVGAIAIPLAEMYGCLWLAFEAFGTRTRNIGDMLAHNPFFAAGETIFGGGTPEILQPAIVVAVVATLALVAATRRVANEFAVGAGKRKGRSPAPLRFEDPILSRAAPRTMTIPTDRRSALVLAFMTTVVFLPVLASRWDDDEIMVGMFLGTWLATLYVFLRSSQTIAPERQRGSLALILAAPVTASRLVDTHFAGLFCHAARLLFPAFVLGALAVADGEIRLPAFLAWCVATPVLVALHIAVGIWRSAVSPTGGRAVASSIVAVFVTSIGWGLLTLAVVWVADVAGMREDYVGIPLVSVIPAAWHGMLVGVCTERTRNWGSEELLVFWSALIACLASVLLCIRLRIRARRALEEDNA